MKQQFLNDDEIIELKKEFWEISKQHWLKDDISEWTWWLNIALIIISLIVWLRLVDRKRLLEIILFGLLLNISATILDTWGIVAVIWEYPDRLLAYIPQFIPVNFFILPITFMLIYQYFTSWKSFTIATVITSAIYAFIAEPLLVWLNIYRLIQWKYIYSFPVYIIMVLLIRWFTKIILSKNIN